MKRRKKSLTLRYLWFWKFYWSFSQPKIFCLCLASWAFATVGSCNSSSLSKMSAKFLNIFLYALLCLLLAVDCQAPIDHKSTISSDAQPACLTSDSECKLSSENGNPITEHGGKQECFLVNGERIPVQSIDGKIFVVWNLILNLVFFRRFRL